MDLTDKVDIRNANPNPCRGGKLRTVSCRRTACTPASRRTVRTPAAHMAWARGSGRSNAEKNIADLIVLLHL